VAQVLLVENDSVIAEIVADELAVGGHMVDVARTGFQALSKLRTRRPDIVVLDSLPVCDASAFIELYREASGSDELPIIAMTANGPKRLPSGSLGTLWFTAAPFDIDDLTRVIDDALSKPSGATRHVREDDESVTQII